MGCAATTGMAASKDPKYHSTAFCPKTERPRNKKERSPQTSIKFFLVHDLAPVVGWPHRWEHDTQVCQVFVHFFVCSHFPMGVLIWPARLGKAGSAPIASLLHPWHSSLGPELMIWGPQEVQAPSVHVLQPSENLLPTGANIPSLAEMIYILSVTSFLSKKCFNIKQNICLEFSVCSVATLDERNTFASSF